MWYQLEVSIVKWKNLVEQNSQKIFFQKFSQNWIRIFLKFKKKFAYSRKILFCCRSFCKAYVISHHHWQMWHQRIPFLSRGLSTLFWIHFLQRLLLPVFLHCQSLCLGMWSGLLCHLCRGGNLQLQGVAQELAKSISVLIGPSFIPWAKTGCKIEVIC